MTDSELDSIYTQLCQTMTEIGEARSPLFLARFALLAITAIDDAAATQRLIADARDGLDNPGPSSARPANGGEARPCP